MEMENDYDGQMFDVPKMIHESVKGVRCFTRMDCHIFIYLNHAVYELCGDTKSPNLLSRGRGLQNSGKMKEVR